MGSIFGKQSVKEPPYEVLFRRTTGNNVDVATPYELRKYATRYAAMVEYNSTSTSEPFRILAKYIGVFGTPQNEGKTNIAMTAPVVMEDSTTQGPTPIAMTAPVVMENNATSSSGMKKMMFMLPEEFNDLSKIPTPTNPAVQILQLPSEIGAVHTYNGQYNTAINEEKAQHLGRQLHSDGLVDMTEEYVMGHYQFWGYNPPFTIPYFRRNEIWIPLREEQARLLKERFPSSIIQHSHGVGGGSAANKTMSKTAMISLGLCGLVLSAYAVGFVLNRSRAQYRRL